MSSPWTPDDAPYDAETGADEEVNPDGHRATDMPSLGDPARIALPDPFAEADAELLREPGPAADPEPAADSD
ncbi:MULTISPECIES: hypothetical protein [unclassified Streptomyces]|uniref:hypothetical protein n=1 Tax=unclassified Streptomyces TaxID=2593676 RepID=UPI0022720C72|nr:MULTISPECIES: hypothetical protein [unclassified Streptomyces]MCY0919737.1 hypothetical protein [Streptomyces sp. H27-G5]MCY0958670.1 hypothetical protein [Streptomyces sp. H27-H5]